MCRRGAGKQNTPKLLFGTLTHDDTGKKFWKYSSKDKTHLQTHPREIVFIWCATVPSQSECVCVWVSVRPRRVNRSPLGSTNWGPLRHLHHLHYTNEPEQLLCWNKRVKRAEKWFQGKSVCGHWSEVSSAPPPKPVNLMLKEQFTQNGHGVINYLAKPAYGDGWRF